MWPCIGTAAQKFTFTAGGEIRFAGYCLDSVGATPTNGSRIRLMYCKTGDRSRRNQQWHLRGSVRGVGAACLQVRGGVPFDGAKAQLGSCWVAATRTWDYWF
jgi:glucosylceramidase